MTLRPKDQEEVPAYPAYARYGLNRRCRLMHIGVALGSLLFLSGAAGGAKKLHAYYQELKEIKRPARKPGRPAAPTMPRNRPGSR